ncbi:AAA family ATPase [Staphylococcus simulans]|uniref:AAA family ATPase n=1 Tax=Staphylococcus simulans TaxID=1286 RepID=UPI0018EACC34|nr:AAA family ATPase [Staphylococcus simulans]MCE5023462.1 AAA family ATPase [Staphylococcus simulans]UXR34880.1 AAA family ATPase [Staphylococcus simulans]
MKIRLKKLRIENFAGITKQTFNFGDNNTNIYGANASGKTTTAVALQWLLFDKGLDGTTKSFNLVPLDKNNQEQYELTPTVTAEMVLNDKPLTLRKESHAKYTTNAKTNRKEYSRSRTKKQYVNEESLKVTEYKNYIQSIVDEDVFKLVTNPEAFNTLDWKKRREILFQIADPISDEAIIETDDELIGINDILSDHDIETKKKILGDKIKQINKDIKDIPTRINEAQKGLQEVEPYNEDDYKAAIKQIEEINNKILEIKNGKADIDLRNQLTDKQSELKRLEQNFSNDTEDKIHSLTNKFNTENSTVINAESTIKRLQNEYEHEAKRRETLLKDYKDIQTQIKEVSAKQFEHTDDTICQCCGQELPKYQIEQAKEKAFNIFNKRKSEELENLKAKQGYTLEQGKSIKPTLENIQREIEKQKQLSNEAVEKSNSIDKKIKALKAEAVDVTQTDEYRQIMQDIADISNKRKDIASEINQQVEELEEELKTAESKKSEIESIKYVEQANERTQNRVLDLRTEEDNLLDEKEELSDQLYKLNKFTNTKIEMLTDNINNKFKYAEFKLFNQLVNGDTEETCITTVNGVEYDSGLNNAARINVGLDIINTLGRYYEIEAPIFIDNAESVTKLIETDAQQIRLIVSGDDQQLRAEDVQ